MPTTEVDELRSAIKKHFAATTAWTKEFHPGGAFEDALPVGADITVDGGKWLVAEVKRLRKALAR
jgi:hypothetical protein